MGRNTKVSAGHNGKPITAFFSLANTSSRQPNSSSNTRLASKSKADTPQNGENSAKLNSSNNQPPISAVNGAKGGTVSPRRSERVKKPVFLQPAATIDSLKRPREPDTQLKPPSTPRTSRIRNTDRRKSKFDSCSEDDAGGAVIYVKSPNPQARKKLRVSLPTESSRADLVPSSQSVEEELLRSNHQPNGMVDVKKRGVTKASKLSSFQRDDTDANAMQVDDDYSSPSQDEVMRHAEVDAEPLKPAARITQMLTPPTSDLSSPPPTPVVSVVAKRSTQNIIAAIKARAYENNLSSPDSDQLDFLDDLDSSDDDQLPILPVPAPKPRNTRRKEKQTNLAPSNRMATRYSLRKSSSSPLEPKIKTQAKPAKKGPDPFGALLKEKNRAAKRGNGNEAIEKAELTVLQYDGRATLLHEMEDEEDSEDALEWGLNASSGSICDILTARNERKDDSDLDLDEGDRERILGEEGRKTVLEILEQDKAEKHKKGNDEKTCGIQLWTQEADADSSAMIVDENYHIPGDSSVVNLLNNSLKCGATIRTSLLLNMNLMAGVRPAERAATASCLLDISLSPKSSPSTDAAVNTLTKFWTSSMQPLTSTIQFKDVLNCLGRSGLDSRILAGQNWEPENRGVCNSQHNRDTVISRLVTLITACARSGRLLRGEIPDISIAMMLIGMDGAASPALQRDLTLAIDSAIRLLSPDDSPSRENEFACASRVLQLSASYAPVNKLRLLSLLSNGSGPSRRIAEFVAYCIIIDKESPTPNLYKDLPPLARVLEQLHFSSRLSSKSPGIFALHQGTNYIDLGFYVAILGVAVSNLKGYVSQERQKAKSASMLETPSKMGDQPKTDLQLLHTALETLHSKISDSRATNLERSRTKAAVKQLAMNVHYQREFWLRHSRETRSITLAQYFKKKI